MCSQPAGTQLTVLVLCGSTGQGYPGCCGNRQSFLEEATILETARHPLYEGGSRGDEQRTG